MLRDCKYRLPCAWCDKYDRPCEAVQYEVHKQEQEKNSKPTECDHEWKLEEQEIIRQKSSYKRYKCSICGKEQIRKDEIQDNGSVNVTLWERV